MTEKNPLSHLDADGKVRMVDVSDKTPTRRQATATAVVTLRADVRTRLLAGDLKKGEALTTAKIAGINAAKRAASLIPLCHPLALDWSEITFDTLGDDRIRVTATVSATGRTGVEMEALTAASVAALTLYDMAKAADKGVVIGPIQLEKKSGGASGDYHRS